MKVTVTTPEAVVFEDDRVDMVVVPGAVGQLGILRGHTPLISNLAAGEIEVRKGQERKYLAVGGGLVEVLENRVTILADTAEVSSQ
ncbi:MAG: ATP synthase F1 subunit epsilon [bacterium]|nr:ATP synthase F1 subunit epsilon [bacterium]